MSGWADCPGARPRRGASGPAPVRLARQPHPWSGRPYPHPSPPVTKFPHASTPACPSFDRSRLLRCCRGGGCRGVGQLARQDRAGRGRGREFRGPVAAGRREKRADLLAQGRRGQSAAGANLAAGLLAGRFAQVERTRHLGRSRGGGAVHRRDRNGRPRAGGDGDVEAKQRGDRHRHRGDAGAPADVRGEFDRVAVRRWSRGRARGTTRVYRAERSRGGRRRRAAARQISEQRPPGDG